MDDDDKKFIVCFVLAEAISFIAGILVGTIIFYLL